MVNQRQTVDDTETETVSDDYQSIDLDIQSLIAKFINPIDRYRSHNSPNVLTIQQSGLQSSDRFQESRASAFYRILGLPTIAPDGRMFSPGFNPRLSAKDQSKRNDIIASLPIALKKASEAREKDSRRRDGYFISGGLDAVLLALAMGLRNGQRPLSVTEGESMASLENPPKQVVAIPARREILKNFKQQGGDEIGGIDVSVSHKIAPFTTDPIISANPDPNSGSLSVMVGAPFLEKEDLEYEYNKYLKRPGLEFILRLRLRQQNIAEQSKIAIDNIDLTKFTDEISSSDQREIATALTDNVNANAEDIKQVLSGGGRIEFYTINTLVKSLKGLVHLYAESLETLNKVSNQIVWIPMPNDGGPERGSRVSTTFVTTKKFLDTWEIEARLANLQIKSALAKLQQEIGETADDTPLQFADFTISEFQNLSNTFDEQIQEETSKRDELEANASNALRNVEIIGGEVSGLGLIDIISIYLALWSLEIPVLLNLIDDGAVQRLNEIDTLRTSSTQARVNNGSDAIDAYTKLADRIQTILSYADGLFKRELGKLIDGGEPPVDQSNGSL